MTYTLAAIAVAAIIVALAAMRRHYVRERDSYDEFLRSLMARSERDNPPRARTIISNEQGEAEL